MVPLHLQRAGRRAVAHQLDHAALLGDLGVDEFLAMALERAQRSRLLPTLDPNTPHVVSPCGATRRLSLWEGIDFAWSRVQEFRC